eukprot:3887414-Amphidinium_carterae.1
METYFELFLTYFNFCGNSGCEAIVSVIHQNEPATAPAWAPSNAVRSMHIRKKSWFWEGGRVLKLWVFQSSSHSVGEVEGNSVLSLCLLSVFH